MAFNVKKSFDIIKEIDIISIYFVYTKAIHKGPNVGKKKQKKPGKKDSQLVIRLNGEVRDRFVMLCDELDTSAAREIRRFINKFLKEHETEE